MNTNKHESGKEPSLLNDVEMLIADAEEELGLARGARAADAVLYCNCGLRALKTARELLEEAETEAR